LSIAACRQFLFSYRPDESLKSLTFRKGRLQAEG
jgi:hypothetical protein